MGKRNTLEKIMCHCTLEKNECHLWLGGKDKDGYGITSWRNKSVRVPRLIAELFLGMAIEKKMILHTCDTPSCINPNHLVLGTGKDNAVDRDRKGRGLKGVKKTPEHIQKIVEARKGWRQSEETKRRISATLTGRTMSTKARANMSAGHSGGPHRNRKR